MEDCVLDDEDDRAITYMSDIEHVVRSQDGFGWYF